jgi:hypothetical protein
MRERLFPLVIALSALAVSGSAAFYSVYGLSKLFAGASFQVMIMAGSLEFAKLVIASLLYQYWDTINKALKVYLSIACFILILITSGGIYGFLSGAYQSTATQSELLDKSLMILNQKQIRFEEQKQDLKIEKNGLTKSISDLRVALSNPAQVQYIDKESGQLITTSSSSARRALQNELTIATGNRDNINIRIEAVMDSINKTDMALLDKEISNEAESELGPLKYLAETTGQDMGVVVNWFLLLIIFVFDPLAIALVVAANMAFAQLKDNNKVKMSIPDGMEFNKSYTVPTNWPEPSQELTQRVSRSQAKIKDQEYSEDNWNESVARLGVNPNSITESIKLEKKDLIVDDLETQGGEEKHIGLDAWIDILEEDEASLKDTDATTEHELYHGKQEISDEEKLIGMIESKKSKTKKRLVKKSKKGRITPKGYKYRG